MNNTKKSFIASLLAMMLCMAMLVGSTFAWFTDSASTGVNSITSGNLDIELQQKNADGDWVEVGTTIGFVKEDNSSVTGEILWEPGCRFLLPELRIFNAGNLAFEYVVKITGTSVAGANGAKLADVIDVFIGDATTPVGTLSQIITSGSNLIEGKLLAKNDVAYLNDAEGAGQIKLVMQTSAGNEYQGLSIDGIKIDVFASQTPHEYDSYDKDYDKGATTTHTVKNSVGFVTAVKDVVDGGTILLEDNLTTNVSKEFDLTDTGKTINIDLNGKTVNGVNGNSIFGVRNNSVGNFFNGTVDTTQGTYTAILARYENAVANVSNMTLSNCTDNGTALASRDNAVINVEDTVINSTVGGCADANAGTINIKDCTFSQTGAYVDIRSAIVVACNGGIVNIDGGKYTGDTYGLRVFSSGGTMNIYDGTFAAETVICLDWNENNPNYVTQMNIYGGSFTGAIKNTSGNDQLNIVAGTFEGTNMSLADFEKYVADGSSVTEKNGVFTVVKN